MKVGIIHNGSRTTGVSWGHPDMWPWGLQWPLAFWLEDSLLLFFAPNHSALTLPNYISQDALPIT